MMSGQGAPLVQFEPHVDPGGLPLNAHVFEINEAAATMLIPSRRFLIPSRDDGFLLYYRPTRLCRVQRRCWTVTPALPSAGDDLLIRR